MILEYIFNGLTVGMTYALIAVGYSLVFGILRLINFSHGAVYALGAHAAFVFIGYGFGPYIGFFAAVLFCGIIGIVIDKAALQPLRKANSPPISSLITTIGVSYIIQNILQILYGTERKPFPKFYDFGNVTIFGVTVTSSSVVIFLVSLFLLLVLTLIIYYTKIGLAMRAIEQNPKAARIVGINVNSVVTFTFFISGASAAIAGTLMAGYYQTIYSTMGFTVGLKAFSAAILGGIGVLYGSIIGGLITGISESLAAGFLGGIYRDSVSFIVLVIILLIKPTGLFGKKGATKL